MRKVQFLAVFWTLLLAIPFTVLAISVLAYWTANLTAISSKLADFSHSISMSGHGILVEFSGRWPEVAGMIIGQLVLMTIFILARTNKATEKSNQK